MILRSIELTEPEIDHLITLLINNKEEGSYYGVRWHWYQRTNKLLNKLGYKPLQENE